MTTWRHVFSIPDALASVGTIETFKADGSVYRFSRHGSRSKSCWYVARLYSGKNGIATFCTHGDWAAGKEFDEQLIETQNGSEFTQSRVIKRIFKENADAAIAERQRLQSKASDVSNTLYAKMEAVTQHPYLDKKHIEGIHKGTLRQDGTDLIVPMQDESGKLWGFQRILASGKKLFQEKQRILGCFYKIHGSLDKILVAEGFATGASLNIATGCTVYIAFNTANLPHITRIAVTTYPESQIFICGDDDVWKDPNKNPGRSAVQKCLEKHPAATQAFPIFKNLTSQPTDWNDLHVNEGLETVTQQMEAIFEQASNPESGTIYPVRHTQTTEKDPPFIVANRVLSAHAMVGDIHGNLYEYNGKHWSPITETMVKSYAHAMDAIEHSTESRRKEVLKTIQVSLAQKKIPWRDLKPSQIPFNNGVYDLSTQQITPHKRTHYLETVIPGNFDLQARCPLWEKCLETWFPDDVDRLLALQEFMGYILMPHARYKKALLCLGPSNTGKSVIAQAIRLMTGVHNTCVIPVEHMDDPRKIAPIKGKMVNLISELSSKSLIADGGFKKLVSTEDSIQIDAKYLQQEEYIPFCKHVIFTNTLPRIDDTSDATYNRLLLINFTQEIAPNEQDPDLVYKLENELDGITTWAALGAMQLYSRRGQFVVPTKSIDILTEHRRTQNPALNFLQDYAVEDKRCSIHYYEALKRFREYLGKPGTTSGFFSALLNSVKIEIENKNGDLWIQGYRLKG